MSHHSHDTPMTAQMAGDDIFAIECLYQPIVHLDSGDVVGFEALARWPAMAQPPDPAAVFADARTHGYLDRLDRAAQHAAVRGASDGGLPADYTLFVNIETGTTTPASPDHTIKDWTRSTTPPRRLVMELTERALCATPARHCRSPTPREPPDWGWRSMTSAHTPTP